MGLARDIEVGGHFPLLHEEAYISLDELGSLSRCGANHPSFDDLKGEDVSPAIALMSEHVDDGFGRLFKDKAAADSFLGEVSHPAPLGNI